MSRIFVWVAVLVSAVFASTASVRGDIVTGLQGHWAFEVSNNLGADSTPNVLHGTNVGATQGTGKVGAGSLSVDGTGNTYIELPDSPLHSPGTGEWSFAA